MPTFLPNQDRVGITNLLLNPDAGVEWDICIENGQILTVSQDEYVTQKIKQVLLTGLGEVQTDLDYGIPWLDEILGVKNPDLVVISSILIEAIEDNEVLKKLGVVNVAIPNIELTADRNLNIGNMAITMSDDTEILVGGVTI